MVNSKKKEEYRMYFQVLIDDIRFSKKQQWNTIYLTLVAIGAILGVFLTVDSKGYCLLQPLPILKISFRSFLIGICIFISSLGIVYILRYYLDIRRYRDKTNRLLREKFSYYTRNLADEEPKWYKFLKKYLFWDREFFWFFILFSFLIVLATGLTLNLIN